MAEDLMRYDQLAQTALRNGVVREALRRVQKSGLPGDHHFFITFNTSFPGVEMTERMRERYPREMTVVLQHQFEGLQVGDDSFSVQLSFDNILELLVIPFESLKAFFDPAVPFGLQFEVVQAQKLGPAERNSTGEAPLKSGPAPKKPPKLDNKAAEKRKPTPENAAGGDQPPEKPKVISLDSFRKK